MTTSTVERTIVECYCGVQHLYREGMYWVSSTLKHGCDGCEYISQTEHIDKLYLDKCVDCDRQLCLAGSPYGGVAWCFAHDIHWNK